MNFRLISVLFLALIGTSTARTNTCSCHQLVWKDAEIQVFRVTIAPHTATSPFWHADDYTFVPMTNSETLETVKAGTSRNPLSENGGRHQTSLQVRNASIRFVHPRETEPMDGQVLFNGGDQEYVALEIVPERKQELPTFQSHLSLFGPAGRDGQDWLLGSYSIRLQSLAPSEYIKLGHAGSALVFAITPLNVENELNKPVSLALGEALSLNSTSNYRNLTNISTRVLVLSKPNSQMAVQSSAPISGRQGL